MQEVFERLIGVISRSDLLDTSARLPHASIPEIAIDHLLILSQTDTTLVANRLTLCTPAAVWLDQLNSRLDDHDLRRHDIIRLDHFSTLAWLGIIEHVLIVFQLHVASLLFLQVGLLTFAVVELHVGVRPRVNCFFLLLDFVCRELVVDVEGSVLELRPSVQQWVSFVVKGHSFFGGVDLDKECF